MQSDSALDLSLVEPRLESRVGKHPFTAGMRAESVRRLAALARAERFPRGAYLWKQGYRADSIYLVERGSIALEILVPLQGPLHVETIDGGQVGGCAWLADPPVWQFDGRAVADVDVLILNGDRLRRECESHAEFGYEVLKRIGPVLANRLRSTRRRILELVQN